ncbi:hypothetical protein B0J17DRAFT_633124 [Rhizoctonia solani]|nr:hypothetical protein B0J17DRAFT_633124 [Rhizoctonia solani]
MALEVSEAPWGTVEISPHLEEFDQVSDVYAYTLALEKITKLSVKSRIRGEYEENATEPYGPARLHSSFFFPESSFMSQSIHLDPGKDIDKAGTATELENVTSLGTVQGGVCFYILDAKGIVKVRNAAYTATTQSQINPWSRNSLYFYWCCFVPFLCCFSNGYDSSLLFWAFSHFNPVRLGQPPVSFSLFTPLALSLRRGSLVQLSTALGSVLEWVLEPLSLALGNSLLANSFLVLVSHSWQMLPPATVSKSVPLNGVGGQLDFTAEDGLADRFLLSAVPAAIVLLAVWFLPKSPRWLIANERDEEARDSLIRYHGASNPDGPLVELEWHKFKVDIATDAADKRWWDHSVLLNTTLLAGALLCLLVLAWRISTSRSMLLLTTITICILIIGTVASGTLLAIYGGLFAKWAKAPPGEKDIKVGQGAVVAFFWFGIVNSFAYTALQCLYPIECLHTNVRAKGRAMYALLIVICTFFNMYSNPIALQNMTVGRALEEQEEIFNPLTLWPHQSAKMTQLLGCRKTV